MVFGDVNDFGPVLGVMQSLEAREDQLLGSVSVGWTGCVWISRTSKSWSRACAFSQMTISYQ